MRKTSIMAAALVLVSSVAFATEWGERQIHLRDGSVLHIENSGAMKMTDAQGRIIEMKEGELMETMDGRVIMMRDNELWQRMPERLRQRMPDGG